MWRNPKHPAPEKPAPPAETGERLATFERGPGVEMRVSLDHYEDRPYVSLRVWERGRDGVWRPTRKGATIRMRELAELVDALGQLEYLAGSGDTRRVGPARSASNRPAG